MARLPRLSVPGHAHLVVWRGHNGQAVFADDVDRAALLAALLELAPREQVAVHGWAWLPAEVWLLLTPAQAEGLPRLMQGLGRRYVRGFNARHARCGTLWEGRYRATVLAPDWVLPGLLFVETLPVQRGVAASAEAHRWSSYAHHAGLQPQRGLQPPAAWWALADTPFARELAWRRRVAEGLPAGQVQRLQDAALHGWPLGDAAFLQAVQEATGRRVVPGRPGRPRRSALSPI
ncbi:MAG: transposase [Tepidimonas sp.]|nr:transposase [Tepidimonas sp.]